MKNEFELECLMNNERLILGIFPPLGVFLVDAVVDPMHS